MFAALEDFSSRPGTQRQKFSKKIRLEAQMQRMCSGVSRWVHLGCVDASGGF
jgi:hypothetical protein